MRILVNFQRYGNWSIHVLADDARTVLTKWTPVASEETMLRLFRVCGATEEAMAEVARDIARWGRGSVWLDVDENARRRLRIKADRP